jgi:hypothetical protein
MKTNFLAALLFMALLPAPTPAQAKKKAAPKKADPVEAAPQIAAADPALPAPAPAESAHPHGLSINQGIYATEVFGRNYYFDIRYNYLYKEGKFFFEGSLGFGSLSSRFWDEIINTRIYNSDAVRAYEFLAGYAYDWKPREGLAALRSIPYLTAGVGGVSLGDESHFAYVLGFGNRIPLPGVLGVDRLSIRYDVRDQMFSQEFSNSEPFWTHNVILIIGVQYFL